MKGWGHGINWTRDEWTECMERACSNMNNDVTICNRMFTALKFDENDVE